MRRRAVLSNDVSFFLVTKNLVYEKGHISSFIKKIVIFASITVTYKIIIFYLVYIIDKIIEEGLIT